MLGENLSPIGTGRKVVSFGGDVAVSGGDRLDVSKGSSSIAASKGDGTPPAAWLSVLGENLSPIGTGRKVASFGGDVAVAGGDRLDASQGSSSLAASQGGSTPPAAWLSVRGEYYSPIGAGRKDASLGGDDAVSGEDRLGVSQGSSSIAASPGGSPSPAAWLSALGENSSPTRAGRDVASLGGAVAVSVENRHDVSQGSSSSVAPPGAGALPAAGRSGLGENFSPVGAGRRAEASLDVDEVLRELDEQERAAVPIGPLWSRRGEPQLGSTGRELRLFGAGKSPFPPWAGGTHPRLNVRLGRTHDALARRNARRQEQLELEHGNRNDPKFDYELTDPRDRVASSTSAAEIMRAKPGFGRELASLRERLEAPVVDCAMSRAMATCFLADHLASGCKLCTSPEVGPEERPGGFHCECWALPFFVDGTRGCRLDFGGRSPPSPEFVTNYDSLGDFPRSAAKGFMKHFRAGGFGTLPPPRPAPRQGDHRRGEKFGERRYREKMPISVASSVVPSRCAPLGAAVRHSDRLRAALLGEEPKTRIIYDLTRVGINGATFAGRRWRFRYAGIDALMPYLTKGCYCASFDLAAFYCQIPVDARTAEYFVAEVPPLSAAERAEMGLVGPGPHYVRYRTLPMGWSASCAHASAFSAAICEEAMRRGAKVAVSYIDDIVIVGDTQQECARSQEIVRKVIEERFGLSINAGKTQLPQRMLEWIGITIDTVAEQFTISAERRRKVTAEIRAILDDGDPTAGTLRSCLGRLSWLAMIMRGARAYASPLFQAIRERGNRERVRLSERDRADLEWFVDKMANGDWVGSKWLEPASEVAYAKSDAGDDAVFLVSGGRFLYHRLTTEERALSSHARELLPAALAAEVFGAEWSGKYVAFAFDNSGTAFSVSSGSSRTDNGARDMLRAIADRTVEHDFAMIGVWAPRGANVMTDAGSKLKQQLWTTEPVRLNYAANELAAAQLEVGAGCWLYPLYRDTERALVLGYVEGDRHWC